MRDTGRRGAACGVAGPLRLLRADRPRGPELVARRLRVYREKYAVPPPLWPSVREEVAALAGPKPPALPLNTTYAARHHYAVGP